MPTEFRDACMGSFYKDKNGEDKVSWYKVGRLAIDGEKMTLFSPFIATPIQMFKQHKKTEEQLPEIDVDQI